MKVLVTGANGMLGQDLCSILEDEDFDVVETDIHNLDITDLKQVEKVLTAEKPDYIVHCAAYTNVDKAEEDSENAFKLNSEATKNIVDIAKKIDATLIYISTDYVFDGEKGSKYLPDDKTNPINVYGASKLKGEEYVKTLDKHYILRTICLYGHHCKNFV